MEIEQNKRKKILKQRGVESRRQLQTQVQTNKVRKKTTPKKRRKCCKKERRREDGNKKEGNQERQKYSRLGIKGHKNEEKTVRKKYNRKKGRRKIKRTCNEKILELGNITRNEAKNQERLKLKKAIANEINADIQIERLKKKKQKKKTEKKKHIQWKKKRTNRR